MNVTRLLESIIAPVDPRTSYSVNGTEFSVTSPAVDTDTSNDDDDDAFQHLDTKSLSLPFICIGECILSSSSFYLCFHDYQHVIEGFYETHPAAQKQAFEKITTTKAESSRVLSSREKRNAYLFHLSSCLQERLEFKFYEVKDRLRLSSIVNTRVMDHESLIDKGRCGHFASSFTRS